MPYSYIDIENKLNKLGFKIIRQKGAHVIFARDKTRIIVPKHGNKDISIGIEKSIIKLLGITNVEFKKI
ncbi:MAG: type II toxin-antitoxin system HicA family toxin [Candidatus Gracilibacteria bacterium]|nr:type II toxin-antitoxin system HicA family toxin [Candidatus Gracilibacteria bacterium]